MLSRAIDFLAIWLIPVLIVAAIIGSLWRRVNLFDRFIEGAKEGFNISVRLIPYPGGHAGGDHPLPGVRGHGDPGL